MSRIAPLLLTAFLVPAAAFAQKAPSVDKEAEKFNEIERGLFFGVQGGWNFFINPPAAEGTPRPFSPGQMAMVEVGYEFGERVSVAGFLIAAGNRASSTYIGFSNNRASGDFFTMVPGATARVNLLGFNDGQDVKRTWLYIRAGGGLAMFSPKPLLPNSDVLVFAGPGVEYFTRLRHFSVGLETTGSFMVGSGTVGFAITPNLRYAF